MEAGRGYYVGKRNGRPDSQKIIIWGIKTLSVRVGRGGGRVGRGSGLARRWGRGRVGSARRGPDSRELKSVANGKYLILQSQKMFWICFVILKLCGVFLIVGNFFSRERWGGVLCRLTVSFDHSWVQVVFGSSLARSV